MRSFVTLILMGAYAQISLGGTLEVINFNKQCAIWSYANHGCTGHSAFFAPLNRDDCSKLEEVDGTSQGYPVLGVEACGTEHNSSAAWIEVEQRGRVTFFNKQGDKSTCVLNNGLKLGSRCNVSDLASSTKKSSALATPTTLSPASKLASTYFQTTATSGCSAA